MKTKARKDKLENVAEEDRTLIFYESTHRILDTLADMQDVLGVIVMSYLHRSGGARKRPFPPIDETSRYV